MISMHWIQSSEH